MAQVPSNEWDRQPGETFHRFNAFQKYRDLDPLERTYVKVAEQLQISVQLVSRWARRHNWRFRAEAFDAHTDEIVQRKMVRRKADMQEATYVTATQMHEIGVKALEALKAKLIDEKGNVRQDANLKPLEILQYLKSAAEMSQLALGRVDQARVAKIEVIIGDADEAERRQQQEAAK